MLAVGALRLSAGTTIEMLSGSQTCQSSITTTWDISWNSVPCYTTYYIFSQFFSLICL